MKCIEYGHSISHYVYKTILKRWIALICLYDIIKMYLWLSYRRIYFCLKHIGNNMEFKKFLLMDFSKSKKNTKLKQNMVRLLFGRKLFDK